MPRPLVDHSTTLSLFDIISIALSALPGLQSVGCALVPSLLTFHLTAPYAHLKARKGECAGLHFSVVENARKLPTPQGILGCSCAVVLASWWV